MAKTFLSRKIPRNLPVHSWSFTNRKNFGPDFLRTVSRKHALVIRPKLHAKSWKSCSATCILDARTNRPWPWSNRGLRLLAEADFDLQLLTSLIAHMIDPN